MSTPQDAFWIANEYRINPAYGSQEWGVSRGYGEVSFFSEFDIWDYGTLGYNTCEDCNGFSMAVYGGHELELIFPNLIILDENMIKPNIHPNCGCVMTRLTEALINFKEDAPKLRDFGYEVV